MRIVLDGRALMDEPRDGGAGITAPLLGALADLRPDWELIALGDGPLPEDSPVRPDRPACHAPLQWRLIRPLTARLNLWSNVQFPLAAWRLRADAILTAPAACPRLLRQPAIVAIDELPASDSSATATKADAARINRARRQIHRACRRAAAIIVPSQLLRDQLINQFNVPPRRIHIIRPGLAPHHAVTHLPRHQWHQVLERYDLSRPFVLHHGSDTPQRNTRKLIEAWAMTDKKLRQRMQLAIIGLGNESGEDLVRVVNRLGLAASVRLYARLGDAGDLSALLSAADIAAMPMTACDHPHFLLQAWTARAAVLTSDLPAIATVARDGAALVDPTDAGAIARGLGRLYKDPRQRRDLIERGQQLLAAHTWPHAAGQLAGIIEQVAGSAAPVADDASHAPVAPAIVTQQEEPALRRAA